MSLLAIGSSAPVMVKSRCYCSHQIQRKPALKTYLAERHLTNQIVWKGSSQEVFHANSTKLMTNKTKRAVGAWNVDMETTAHKRALQHFHQCSSWEGRTKCKGSPSSHEHAASLTFRLMCFLSSGLRRERTEPGHYRSFASPSKKKVQSKAELFLLLYSRYPCSSHLCLRDGMISSQKWEANSEERGHCSVVRTSRMQIPLRAGMGISEKDCSEHPRQETDFIGWLLILSSGRQSQRQSQWLMF